MVGGVAVTLDVTERKRAEEALRESERRERERAAELQTILDTAPIVSDQGIGFDPDALPPAGEAGRGFGLFSIRERLELFGGTLEIESSPGQGSRFIISVPITEVEPQSATIAELPREFFTR